MYTFNISDKSISEVQLQANNVKIFDITGGQNEFVYCTRSNEVHLHSDSKDYTVKTNGETVLRLAQTLYATFVQSKNDTLLTIISPDQHVSH